MRSALIVEDGWRRGVLPAVRSLGRAGWRVGIGSQQNGLAAASRWAAAWHPLPAPNNGAEAYVDAVAQVVRRHGYDIVFAGGDAELVALAWGRDAIVGRVAAPPYEVVVRSLDKLDLVEAAGTANVGAPRTIVTDASAGGFDVSSGMVVVKARRPWLPGATGPSRFEASIAESRDDARRRIADVLAAGGEPLLQQRVAGALAATVTLVRQNGTIAGHMQQRATSVWPQPAGVSVRAQVVAPDPDLERGSLAVLAELGWHGLAELQFLVDAQGKAHLLDCNGRFYGSLALAVGAGFDAPNAWALDLIGEPTAASTPRTGTRYHWLEGDLRRARAVRRGGLVTDLLDCARWAWGAAHSTLSVRDPRPLLRRARLVARQLRTR